MKIWGTRVDASRCTHLQREIFRADVTINPVLVEATLRANGADLTSLTNTEIRAEIVETRDREPEAREWVRMFGLEEHLAYWSTVLQRVR